MTVCGSYFTGGLTFWVSLIMSIAIISFLSLYIPLKKIKSKWKFAFIPLFIILLTIVSGINLAFLGTENNCKGLWEKHLVQDYKKDITSMEEAKEILRQFAIEQLKTDVNYANYVNQIEDFVNQTYQENNTYHSTLNGFNCYELHTNGKLYKYWCGN